MNEAASETSLEWWHTPPAVQEYALFLPLVVSLSNHERGCVA